MHPSQPPKSPNGVKPTASEVPHAQQILNTLLHISYGRTLLDVEVDYFLKLGEK